MKTLLTFMAVFALQTNASAATWGVAELLDASKAATDTLKAKLGPSAYGAVVGISMELNSQKLGAKANITYTDQGQTKSVSYFCHEHGGDIDCH